MSKKVSKLKNCHSLPPSKKAVRQNLNIKSVFSVWMQLGFLMGVHSEAYSEPCQTPKMECSAKTVNG